FPSAQPAPDRRAHAIQDRIAVAAAPLFPARAPLRSHARRPGRAGPVRAHSGNPPPDAPAALSADSPYAALQAAPCDFPPALPWRCSTAPAGADAIVQPAPAYRTSGSPAASDAAHQSLKFFPDAHFQ